MSKPAMPDMIRILEAAVEHGASDVVLSVSTTPILRIDGALCSLGNRAMTADDVKRAVYSIIDSGQIARFENTRELEFSFNIENGQRFRGSVFVQRGTMGAVFRLIPTVIPTITELGLPDHLKRVAMAPHGLFLITGATGMGKSTTLAAMIAEINHNRFAHVICIEDPIEFVHVNDRSVIEQREVGTDTEGFHIALRHSLRQSPDVIMVGEMRDLETMTAAVTAAETGHLVLATLHTRDTSKSVARIIDSFPSAQQNQVREQLAMSLLGVMSQRLFRKAVGSGRIVATELLLNTPAVAHHIRESREHMLQGVLETSSKIGMYTFEANLRELVFSGRVYRDEAEAFLGRRLSI